MTEEQFFDEVTRRVKESPEKLECVYERISGLLDGVKLIQGGSNGKGNNSDGEI